MNKSINCFKFSLIILLFLLISNTCLFSSQSQSFSNNQNRANVNSIKQTPSPMKNNMKLYKISFPLLFHIVGYIASALVFAAFYMKTMIPLRITAIVSNVVFIFYAILGNLLPILILHGVLLPLNSYRLKQMLKLIKKVKEASSGEKNVDFLIPYMTLEKYKEGQLLFNKGDKADKIFFIQKGSAILPELQKELKVGDFLGEVGIFAPSNARACSAIVGEDSDILTITADKVLQLYYQNPTFGFFMIRMIAKTASESGKYSGGMIVTFEDLTETNDDNFSIFSNCDLANQKESKTDNTGISVASKNLTISIDNGALIINGNLIWEEIRKEKDKIESILKKEFNTFDITNLLSIDSSGIGLLITLYRKNKSINVLKNNVTLKFTSFDEMVQLILNKVYKTC